MSTHFHIGDQVRLLDEDGQGKVLAISENLLTVDVDGFELEVSISEVVKVEFDDDLRGAPETKLSQKDKAIKRAATQKLQDLAPKEEATYELDLHIHELLDDYRNMSNGEILQYQMRCCRSFIQEAKSKRYPKVVLIHGVGEGILRQEIHNYLDTLDKVDYHDAPYRIYGYGATEVIIR